MDRKVKGLGIWVQDFGFKDLISKFNFQKFGFKDLESRIRIQRFAIWIQRFGLKIFDSRFWNQEFRVGFKNLAFRLKDNFYACDPRSPSQSFHFISLSLINYCAIDRKNE